MELSGQEKIGGELSGVEKRWEGNCQGGKLSEIR